MSDKRPRIDPALLAAIIEAAPGRVRKRLDRQPTAADAWTWQVVDSGFEITAGEETVHITTTDDAIRDIGQLRCSCLLSPKCFHVLACVTSLEADTADTESADDHVAKDAAEDAADRQTEPTMKEILPQMRDAASGVRDAVTDILKVGARASGALLQSALLRAGHQCRAADLPMLGNTTLRIAEGVRRIRAQSDTADAGSLRNDLFVSLQATERIARDRTVPAWIVGTKRREYHAINVSRLEGWFAEPILTGSGYAGVCVHLLTPNGKLNQVTDMRPGDSQLVQQAYNGGIDLGTTTASGRDLSRGKLLVQRLTASVDGRLGKGKSTRWVLQGDATFDEPATRLRFERPLSEQVAAIFNAADQPLEERRGGWDLLAFDAELMGPIGAAILAKVRGAAIPWRLRIANDHPDLAFRENLELLARCPGLRIRCVGRLRIEAAGEVDLLAIGDSPTSIETADTHDEENPPAPRLLLPDAWCGECNIGLDRLQRHHIDQSNRWAKEVRLDEQSAAARSDDGLSPLERRLNALTLGGYRAIPGPETRTHRRDTAAFTSRNQSTASTLVDHLATASSSMSMSTAAVGTERRPNATAFDKTLLACASYLQAARLAFHRQRWLEYADGS